MSRLLLLADNRCVAQLRDTGTLPDSFWAAFEPGKNSYSPQKRDGCLRYCDPSFLHDPALGIERRDAYFAEMLECVCCHLVVLENPKEVRKTGTDWNEFSYKGTSKIPDLVSWYESFKELAERHLGGRSAQHRHILILICAEEIPNEQLTPLENLLNSPFKGSNLFDRCYVMLRQLECGPAEAYHSRYVWPISVSRLLLTLMATPARQADARATAIAWRCFEAAPELPDGFVDERFESAMNQVRAALTPKEASTKSDGKAEIFPQVPALTQKFNLDADPPQAEGDWLHYSARSSVERLKQWSVWEPKFVKAGAAFSGYANNERLKHEPDALSSVQKAWDDVHRDPENIYVLLKDKSLISRPELARHLRAADEKFRNIEAQDHERKRVIDETGACAEILEETRNSFVSLDNRILFAVAISLFAGYYSMILFHQILGMWLWSILISVAGALTAGITALVLWHTEYKRGQAGTREFQKQLQRIHDQTDALNLSCQSAVREAHAFLEEARAAAAAQKLKLLLQRVQLILQTELDAPTALARCAGRVETTEAAGDAELSRMQRAAFLKATLLQLKTYDSRYQDQSYTDLIEQETRALREQLWTDFCSKDSHSTGLLPASDLVAMLRRFRTNLRAELQKRIFVEAATPAQSTGSETKQLFDTQSRGRHYLSCKPELGNHLRQTVIVSASAPDEIKQANTPNRIVSDLLDACPFVALVTEEMTISLSKGQDGAIKAVAQ
ncbi:MAG TPA: hypothetical protein VEK08_24450 [Planctomycetota bacterium]|nr:hypothetical protein [Planctomycetota bacterium]